MKIEEIKDKLYRCLTESVEKDQFIPQSADFSTRLLYLMMRIFEKPMSIYGMYHVLTGNNPKFTTSGKEEFPKELRDKIGSYNRLITVNTALNLEKYLDDNNIPYISGVDYQFKYYILEDDICIVFNTAHDTVIFISDKSYRVPEWFESLLYFKPEDKKHTYLYVVHSSHGFTTTELSVNEMDIDIKSNYNDDLPDAEIKHFLNSDNSGIVILHGEPGTGKSTYIRHLISEIDNRFLYLDTSCFAYMTDASFINLLMQFKNAVIILEDAENLLKKRELSGAAHIASLLNMTDGLLGDALHFKVLCTFNAKLENIDEAVLRKGRLKTKYQFNKLSKDKVIKLLDKIGIKDEPVSDEATLADIYNIAEKVDFTKKKKKSVGFQIEQEDNENIESDILRFFSQNKSYGTEDYDAKIAKISEYLAKLPIDDDDKTLWLSKYIQEFTEIDDCDKLSCGDERPVFQKRI